MTPDGVALAPGTALDRYTVEAVLGRGGMAVVYRVRHRQLGTQAAMKVLMVQGSSIRQRLLQEGRVQAGLQHPNIVAVTDIVDVNGAPGIVMELIRGPSLEQLLAEQRLTLEQCDMIAAGLLRGVEAAHIAGLVHRDLKPGNVLLAVTADGLVPRIADFGLVKMLESDPVAAAVRTRSGVTMGTPAYMAPEQVRNARHVDRRADIFALGAILYEMVTGRRAFDGADVLEILTKVASAAYPPIHVARADVPDRMDNAIRGALTVDKEKRVQTASALLSVWQGVATADSSGGFDLARLRDRYGSADPGVAPTPAAAKAGATFDGSDATPAPAPWRSALVDSLPSKAPTEGAVGLLSSIDPDIAPVLAPTLYPEATPPPAPARSLAEEATAQLPRSLLAEAIAKGSFSKPVRRRTSWNRWVLVGGAAGAGLLALIGSTFVALTAGIVVIGGHSAAPVVQEPPADLASAMPTRAPAAVPLHVNLAGDVGEVWLIDANGERHALPGDVVPGSYAMQARFAGVDAADLGLVDVVAGSPRTVTCARSTRSCW